MVDINGVNIEFDDDEKRVLTGSATRESVAENRKVIKAGMALPT